MELNNAFPSADVKVPSISKSQARRLESLRQSAKRAAPAVKINQQNKNAERAPSRRDKCT